MNQMIVESPGGGLNRKSMCSRDDIDILRNGGRKGKMTSIFFAKVVVE